MTDTGELLAPSEVEQRLIDRVAELDRRRERLSASIQGAIADVRDAAPHGGEVAGAARARHAHLAANLGHLRKERDRVRGVLALERLRPLFDAVLELGDAAEAEIADAGPAAVESLQWSGADLLLELARLASTGARTQWPAARRLIDKEATRT